MKTIVSLLLITLLLTTAYGQVTLNRELKNPKQQIVCAAISQDNNYLATGNYNDQVFLWDLNTNQPIGIFAGLKDPPLTIKFSPDNKQLITAGKDDKISIFSIPEMNLLNQLTGHKKQIESIDISPDGKILASASHDKSIRIWNLKTGELIKELLGHTDFVMTVNFNRDGSKLVSGGADHQVIIWDMKTLEVDKKLIGHKSWVRNVKFSPDNSCIVSGGDERKIFLWDAKTGNVLAYFLLHRNYVQTIAFSADGRYIISGAHDKYFAIVEIETGKIIYKSNENVKDFIMTAGFSPDGKLAFTGELFVNSIKLWNVEQLKINPEILKKKASIHFVYPETSTLMVEDSIVKLSAKISSLSDISEVSILLNNQIFSTQDKEDLAFSKDSLGNIKIDRKIQLKKGVNALSLKVTNKAGDTLSNTKTIDYDPFIAEIKPEMAIKNGQTVKTTNIPLKYTIVSKYPLEQIDIFSNGSLFKTEKLKPQINESNKYITYSISTDIQLFEGSNKLMSSVTVKDLQIKSTELAITFIKPKPVQIDWVLPTNNSTATESILKMAAYLTSDEPIEEIYIVCNDTINIPSSELSISVEGNKTLLTKDLILIDGTNSFVIMAKSIAGKISSEPRIISMAKQKKLAVCWTNTKTLNQTVYEPQYRLSACVTATSTIKNIKLLNNDMPVKSYLDFSKKGKLCTFELNENVMLQIGKNTFKIQIQDSANTVESLPLNVELTVASLPEITWIYPTANKTSVKDSVIYITANVKSNTLPDKVKIYRNDELIDSCQAEAEASQIGLFQVKYPLKLIDGYNSVYLAAQNNKGQVKSGSTGINFNRPVQYVTTEAQTENPNQNRFAVIIGNEDYSSYQTGLEKEANVEFAINDAQSFMEYAKKFLNVPEENIVFKTNARYMEMNNAMKKIGMITKTNAEAEIIFYYAGHGLPDEKTKEPYLVPVDVSSADLEYAIPLKGLYAKLTENPTKRITVFLDACFSGGARNVGLVQARAVKVKPKEEILSSNLVVITSSSNEQSSLPYKAKGHGIFTYFLLKKIEETKGNVKYKDLFEYVQKQVSTQSIIVNSKDQVPQCNISPTITDKWQDWNLK
jgi:WD40 repeat protein